MSVFFILMNSWHHLVSVLKKKSRKKHLHFLQIPHKHNVLKVLILCQQVAQISGIQKFKTEHQTLMTGVFIFK